MQTEERFVELMERYKRVIYKVCYVYAPPDQIEDYFQETVLALWRSYRLFRGECSHSTWIYRVALHTCLSFVRRRMRRPPCVPLAVDLSADDDSGSREQLEELYAMISRLGRLDRAVVLLWLEECSYDEIARITGLTRQNVGVRLTRIREKLRMMTNG